MNINSVCTFLESLEDKHTAQSFMDWLTSEIEDDRVAFNNPEFDKLADSVNNLKNKLKEGL